MSQLETLIQQLCPYGVEYKKFEDVCQYIRGITYNKAQEAKVNDTSPWKVMRANNITLGSNVLNLEDIKLVKKEVKVKKNQLLQKGDILICAGSGSKEHIGKVAYIFDDMDYTFGGFMAVIRCKDDLNSRFLFHILTGSNFSMYLSQALNSTTINNLNAGIMKNFLIPVPPMEVQRVIVQILDQFAELTEKLTAELTAELSARKKQYEHYLEDLLTFDESVPIVKLKDVSNTYTGLTYKPSDVSSEGKGVLVLRSSNIKEDRISYLDNVFVQMERIPERTLVKPGDILICVRNGSKALIGKSALIPEINEPMAFGAFMTVLRATVKINNRFLYYLWRSNIIQSQLRGNDAMPINQITNREFSRINIPLPSFEHQCRIVSVLDRLDALCNDLASDLPAEIEARRKQYEYYRDKLLTFKKLKGE